MNPIVHDLKVAAAPDAAYRAAATAEGIKAWWAKDSEIGEAVGAEHTLRFNKADMPSPVTMHFKVEALEPGKKVAWTCTQNDNPAWQGTSLTWEIALNGSGSSVRFTHDGWKDGGPLYDQTVECWKYFIASLQAYLDGDTPTPSD